MIIDNNISELIIKFLSGKISEEDKKVLLEWRKSNIENERLFGEYEIIWKNAQSDVEVFHPNTDLALENVNIRINSSTDSNFKILPLIYKVAAGFLLIAVSLWLLFSQLTQNTPELIVVETQNEKHELILPDGTLITLNKKSKIQYPDHFRKNREIQFEGEGYFVVAKDPEHPFIITTTTSKVEVIGTEFNLRSRQDEEKVEVMVTEGKVAFSQKVDENQKMYLNAGEKGSLMKSKNKIEKSLVDDKNFMSWKTGLLEFKNSSLIVVAHELSNFYQKDIILSDKELENIRFTSSFSNMPLDEVLKVLELSLNVKIDTLSGKIFIAEK